MTKEEVLQKVTDYCNEKSYTSATLTDAFKDKFADHFQKANPEADINDEAIIASMKFAINTAFSSASDIVTLKTNEWTSKENDYKTQIQDLQKKVKTPPTQEPPKVELPEEVAKQLKELQEFKDAQNKQEKFANVMKLAKAGIREDLHASFDKYAKKCVIDMGKEDKEQADAFRAEFQEIFKDTIGDIKPLTPVQSQKQVDDIIASIPKIKVS